MSRAVGIELTDSYVKLVSLDQAGKKHRIDHFHRAPILDDPERPWEERAAAALRDAVAAARIPRNRVFVSLESGEAILREVSLPFKNEDQIRKTVRYELESLVHNYTIEELVVCHYKTGETDKGTHLLTAAVPKKVLEKYLKIFENAGIDPVAVDLDACAVYNAMHYAGAVDTDEPHLLIYGTPKFTKLILVEQRRPKAIRTIRFALPAPAKAPVRPEADFPAPPQEETPSEGMPVVVLEEGEGPAFGRLDAETQGALIGILAKEISRFLLASDADASPSHILLSGEFEDPQAAALLETTTRMPVRTFNLLEAIDPATSTRPEAQSARLAAPIGLALKGVGVDAVGMDFRQEEYLYRKKFDVLKTTALVTLELVVVFLAAMALYLYFKGVDLGRDLKTLREHQEDLYADLYYSLNGDEADDLSAPYGKMRDLEAEYRQKMGITLPIKTSAREAWRDLFGAIDTFRRTHETRRLGDGTLYLLMDNLTVQQTTRIGNQTMTMTLRGKIRNLEFLAALLKEVKKVKLFALADLVGQAPPYPDEEEGQLYQFSIKSVHKEGK